MLSFTGGLKVFVALEPVDLRKSFSGLEGLVSARLGEDLRQGALFVFTNRRHSWLKILYWDGTGLWLLIKRLEQGTFSWPKVADAQAVKLRLAPSRYSGSRFRTCAQSVVIPPPHAHGPTAWRENKTSAGRLVTRHDENMDQIVGMALAEFEKLKPMGTAGA